MLYSVKYNISNNLLKCKEILDIYYRFYILYIICFKKYKFCLCCCLQ